MGQLKKFIDSIDSLKARVRHGMSVYWQIQLLGQQIPRCFGGAKPGFALDILTQVSSQLSHHVLLHICC